MADLLIKGIDLPKYDDEYVIFTVYGDGGVVYGPLNRPHMRYKNRAVPVPPHGRLIDENDFFSDDIIYPNKQFKKAMKDFVSDMPTVIEASDSNEYNALDKGASE